MPPSTKPEIQLYPRICCLSIQTGQRRLKSTYTSNGITGSSLAGVTPHSFQYSWKHDTTSKEQAFLWYGQISQTNQHLFPMSKPARASYLEKDLGGCVVFLFHFKESGKSEKELPKVMWRPWSEAGLTSCDCTTSLTWLPRGKCVWQLNINNDDTLIKPSLFSHNHQQWFHQQAWESADFQSYRSCSRTLYKDLFQEWGKTQYIVERKKSDEIAAFCFGHFIIPN